jgi:hypothetical protein
MTVDGAVFARGDLLAGGDCTARALSVRGQVGTAGSMRVREGLIADAGVACGMHLDAGWGVKAGGDIVAAGAIRAGESLESGGHIRAGQGYGIFAGLCVQREEWETSARVGARSKPEALVSGFWTGAADARDRVRHAVMEAQDAH